MSSDFTHVLGHIYVLWHTHAHTLSHIHHMHTALIPLFFLSEPQGTKELAELSQALRMVGHRRQGRAHRTFFPHLQTLLRQASGIGQGLFYRITFRGHLSGVPQHKSPCCDLLRCQESPSKGPCSQCPACHPMPFHPPVSAISLYPKIWIVSSTYHMLK